MTYVKKVANDTVEKPKQNRILTYAERGVALEQAKARGLPDGWTVEWNNDLGQSQWTGPDGKTICKSIPQVSTYWTVRFSLPPEEFCTYILFDNRHSPYP